MDLINIALIIAIGLNFSLGVSIFFHRNRGDKFTTIFSALAITMAIWSAAMVFYRFTTDQSGILFIAKILYTIPLLIPILFLYFSSHLTNITPRLFVRRFLIALISITTLSLFLLTLLTDKIILSVNILEVGENEIFFGEYYIFYILYYFILFFSAFYFLIRKFLGTTNVSIKNQLLILSTGTFISLSFGLMTDLVLPWFGYFATNWLANFTSIIFIGFILYAILQYKLFNLRIVSIETFIIFIISLLAVNVVFYQTQTELFIKIALFVSISVLSIFLLRSVYREVEHREEIERLAKDLEKANVRLKELDRLKSEFVSIASHQLRSPLTSIKGYASLILEGSFGEVAGAVKEAVKKIFDSSGLMMTSVQDFLDVSKIEQGKMDYHFEIFDVKDLAKLVVEELNPAAQKSNLNLSFKAAENGSYTIKADYSKIKQVLSNLIDNSIKYTVNGSVTVQLSNKEKGEKVLLTISDTGIGISKEALPKLFDKFVRSRNAHDVNVTGTGLGLYVVKEMLKAHKGKVWAESEGEGSGATFYVELDAYKETG